MNTRLYVNDDQRSELGLALQQRRERLQERIAVFGDDPEYAEDSALTRSKIEIVDHLLRRLSWTIDG